MIDDEGIHGTTHCFQLQPQLLLQSLIKTGLRKIQVRVQAQSAELRSVGQPVEIEIAATRENLEEFMTNVFDQLPFLFCLT